MIINRRTSFTGVYRRSRLSEELIQSPPLDGSAVNAQSDMRIEGSPSPEALGKLLHCCC